MTEAQSITSLIEASKKASDVYQAVELKEILLKLSKKLKQKQDLQIVRGKAIGKPSSSES